MAIEESELVGRRKRGAVEIRGPLSPGNSPHSSDTLPSLNTQCSRLPVNIILSCGRRGCAGACSCRLDSGNGQLDIFQVRSLEKVPFSATIWGDLELLC